MFIIIVVVAEAISVLATTNSTAMVGAAMINISSLLIDQEVECSRRITITIIITIKAVGHPVVLEETMTGVTHKVAGCIKEGRAL